MYSFFCSERELKKQRYHSRELEYGVRNRLGVRKVDSRVIHFPSLDLIFPTLKMGETASALLEGRGLPDSPQCPGPVLGSTWKRYYLAFFGWMDYEWMNG